ncbi:VOC family protein [Leptospira kanakyensis]|uniref:VOC family protein n=1 Tax=Leptospira kanakyensis TaxID=2484968 RepID=A0A6N4Q636_9LEPT|nr:VOC family protein [Leptospira kanakyensis]MCW7471004.1 VOC family protein [Leptospira kanakyensis]TGK54577.1 VOC family protein [Leptospira kanakyensis]TGK58955.1 VOC family protein [Leptospira kanakyensis]TGK75106.1 VOC family protein [Leptospira kanakyensis]
MIHHIAIGTPDPSHLAAFYLKIPGAKQIQEFHYPSGLLRSVWIEFGQVILMLEEGEKKSSRALVFSLTENEKSDWIQFLTQIEIQNKTEYTVYFLDTDGNLLGLSNYPEKLRII